MTSDATSTSFVTSQANSAACARLLRRLRRLLTDLRLAIDDGDLLDAAIHWQGAFDLARDDTHTQILAKAAFAACVKCDETRNYDNAITWMRRAIMAALELRDHDIGQGPIVNKFTIGLARLYIILKDWFKAEDCVEVVRDGNDVCHRDALMVRLICAVKRSLSPERIAVICSHIITLPNLSVEYMEKVLSLVGPVCPSLENRCLEMAANANSYHIVEHILSQCVVTHLRRNEKDLALEKLYDYTDCFKRRIHSSGTRATVKSPILVGRAAARYESLVLACDAFVRQLSQEEDYESASKFCALLLDLCRLADDAFGRKHFEAHLLNAVKRRGDDDEAESLVELHDLESVPSCMALVLRIRLADGDVRRAHHLVSSVLKVKDVAPSTKKEMLLVLFSWTLSDAGSSNAQNVCSFFEDLIFDEDSFGWLLSDDIAAMTVQLAVRLRLQLWLKANEEQNETSLHECVNGIYDLVKRLGVSPSLQLERQSWLVSVCWNLALNTHSDTQLERCRLLSACAGLSADRLQRTNCHLLLVASAAEAAEAARETHPPPEMRQLVDVAFEQCVDDGSCDENTRIVLAVFKTQLAVIRNVRLQESLVKIIQTGETNLNLLLTLSALLKFELGHANLDSPKSIVLNEALACALRKAAHLALAHEGQRHVVVLQTFYLVLAEAVDQKNLSWVSSAARDLLAFLRSLGPPSDWQSDVEDVLVNTLRRIYAAVLMAAGENADIGASLMEICKHIVKFTPSCQWEALEDKVAYLIGKNATGDHL